MLEFKIACAVLAVSVALYSATLFIIVKINLAVALLCLAAVIALLASLLAEYKQPRKMDLTKTTRDVCN
jgi:hypothetical protein